MTLRDSQMHFSLSVMVTKAWLQKHHKANQKHQAALIVFNRVRKHMTLLEANR